MELDLAFLDSDPGAEEADEPSVLEYAREQGICVDYTTELARLFDGFSLLGSQTDQDTQDPLDDALTNAVAAARKLTNQRLAVIRDAALLLKSVLALREPLREDPFTLLAQRPVRGLKQEVPVLRTDPELDLLSFGRRVEPDFEAIRAQIPCEYVDDGEDEGFGWPEKYFAYPAQCDARLKKEKLAVTKEVLKVLQDAVKDDFKPGDCEKIIAEELEKRGAMVARHMTPPLLPLSPPLTPYIPSSPANHLPLAPESSDPIAAEAKDLEQKIMAKDSLAREHSGSSDSMLLDRIDLSTFFDTEETSSPCIKDCIPTALKRRADDLKVEGPLTPPILSDSPMKKLKSVSFSNMIQVGDSLEPWTDDHLSEMLGSQSTTAELIKEIEPIAKEAKWKVENEKLTGADTISRVDVPALGFKIPVAPWEEFSLLKKPRSRSGVTELEAQTRFLQYVKRDDLKSATIWRGVSDLDYSWAWFASPTSNIKLNEKIHGETEFNKIQAELRAGNIATSSNEIWKKEGLRVLDEEEDDEDDYIDHANFEERNDMEALIRKRKLEIEEQEELMEVQRRHKEMAAQSTADIEFPRQGPVERLQPQNKPNISHDLHKISFSSRPQKSHPPVIQQVPENDQRKASAEFMFGDFSASAALHRFMQIQGIAIKPAETAVSTKGSSAALIERSSARADEPFVEEPLPTAQESGSFSRHVSRTILSPRAPLDLSPCSIIVSLPLVQRRALMRHIEHLHPNAELIYRDYSLPHSVASEADIILSPSTGVTLTTLQQIKQTPLPGQVARSPIKERISMLQERYERLVVLVSEGLNEDSDQGRPEDARDKEALKGLETLAAQLDGEVIIQLIQGGEQALAKAVAESIGHYGLPHGGIDIGDLKLFAMETTVSLPRSALEVITRTDTELQWEVFLRRAGFNAFAAQAIIAAFKVPTVIALPSLSSSPAPYEPQRTIEAAGLSMFLLMESEDRVKHFQALMGGRRILDKVSRLLDQRWLSAVHGFRM